MKSLLVVFVGVLFLSFSSQAYALNSSSVIGVGTLHSMGGAGIAMEGQDAVSAAFLNPAQLTSIKKLHFFSGGRFLFTDVNAEVDYGVGPKDSESQINFVLIPPEFGNSFPMGQRIVTGFAAYPLGGFGVDYRNQNVGNAGDTGVLPPGFGDIKSTVAFIQMAPLMGAYEIVPDKLSFGTAFIFNYGLVDFGAGTEPAYGFGGRFGLRYQALRWFSVGASYETPIVMNYNRLLDFDNDGTFDSLHLNQPQRVNFGIAFKPIQNLDIALDGKWINLTGVDGFDDLDTRDQLVAAIRGQYRINKRFTVRAGYNFGTDPLKNNSGFVGENPKTFQGYNLGGGFNGTLIYETLRTLAVQINPQHHATFGLGYWPLPMMEILLTYEYDFKKSLKETGTLNGTPVSLEGDSAVHVLAVAFKFLIGPPPKGPPPPETTAVSN